MKHIVSVFMQVKTENLHESAALYAVASELDTRSYVRSVEARNRLALETMLDSASDRRFADTPGVTFVFMGALFGPIRLLLEGDPEQQDIFECILKVLWFFSLVFQVILQFYLILFSCRIF
ncbi:hypothetical protein [Erwinia sp. MYb416]|uniref:hypothetical protein n=1 Tax=Erwinia sp. MYb416 TaxID=3108532 RepID=UPI00309A22A8